jgi:single-stranded DNA-binding protein
MITPDTNDVRLTGNLAADPQHRTTTGGLPVANAKIVVTSRYLSTTQAAVTTTLNLVFYGPMADHATLFTGGMRVSIEGEVVARSTSPTEKRTTTEIIVRKIFRIYTDDEIAGPTEQTNTAEFHTTGDDPQDWA